MTAIKRISAVLSAFAGLCLIVLMLLIFVDVIGRYFFNSPMTFSVELVELMMGLLVCFGLATTALHGGHVSVDLVGGMAPAVVNWIFARLAALAGVIFLAIMAWKLWERAAVAQADGLVTPILFLPVYPVIYLMSLGSLAALLVCTLSLFVDLDRQTGDKEALD